MIECEGHGGSLVRPVYYVGKTEKAIEDRFKEHSEKKDGAVWTGLHKPIRIVDNAGSSLDADDKYSEDTLVYRTMEIHGIENVRGGMYSQIVLSESTIESLVKKMTAANDQCYRCGNKGHFIKRCPSRPASQPTATATSIWPFYLCTHFPILADGICPRKSPFT